MRGALGGIAVALGTLELAGVTQRTAAVWIVASLLILSGAGLIVGFLTPFVSLLASLCVLAITLSWVPGPSVAPVGVTLLAVLMLVTGLGIALLGPGAFSLDGFLFGRREIVIPPRSPEAR